MQSNKWPHSKMLGLGFKCHSSGGTSFVGIAPASQQEHHHLISCDCAMPLTGRHSDQCVSARINETIGQARGESKTKQQAFDSKPTKAGNFAIEARAEQVTMMMRHQSRPKSQPPIKFNEVCSNYKRQQQQRQQQVPDQHQATGRDDNENHWLRPAERYEHSRGQFRGSLGNLETLEELECDSTTSGANSAQRHEVKEDPLLISSPSSSSSSSLAGSTLSLSSTVSSASTVMAAAANGLAGKPGASSSHKPTASSDEDDQNQSSSSSTASSSGVSSQTNCSLEAPRERTILEPAVAECLVDLVGSVALNSSAWAEDSVLLSIDVHMIRELQVEFPYERSEFNDVQIIKMARRHIFNALKRANELGEREPAWRATIIRNHSKAAAGGQQQPFISWYQSAPGAARLAQESMSERESAPSDRPTEVCVSADEIIGCLIEHELVIWLVERAPVERAVEVERAIRSASGEQAQREAKEERAADYLLGVDKSAARNYRKLVPRSRQRSAPVELAGGNLIGVELGDLHSIDALVWLCQSERDASRVRDQWRQELADWRPPESGNSSQAAAGGNVTSTSTFEQDFAIQTMAGLSVDEREQPSASAGHGLLSKSIGTAAAAAAVASEPNRCQPSRSHQYDQDSDEQMSESSDEGGAEIEMELPASAILSAQLERGQKMEPPPARQKRLATGFGGLKNCRDSIFVHSASHLRNLAEANSNHNFKHPTTKSGSTCDLSRASSSRLGPETGPSLKAAESLSQLPTLTGADGQTNRSAARAVDHQRRCDSLEPLAVVVDKNDDAASAAASGRRQSAVGGAQAAVPAVKPRMSILKNKQQQRQTVDKTTTAAANPATKQEASGQQVAAERQNAAAQRADRKQQPTSDRRLSVSSIRLNSNGRVGAASRAAAATTTRTTNKPKSILRNGSDERNSTGSSGSSEPRYGKQQQQQSKRSSLAQPPCSSESEPAGVWAKLARSSSSASEINKRRHPLPNQEQRLSATNEAGSRQRVGVAQAEQSGRSERIGAPRTSTDAGSGRDAQQRRKSIANFDAPTGKQQLADAERVSASAPAPSKACKQAKQPDTQLDDEEFVSSGSLARERAFERLRQRASCYDITRLMSRNDTIQSQLARLRSGDARQRKPAELKRDEPHQLAAGARISLDTSEFIEAGADYVEDAQAKRVSTITIEGAKCVMRGVAEGHGSDRTLQVRAAAVRQLGHSLANVDWTKRPAGDAREDKSESKMVESSKVIEVKSGNVPTGGVAVLPLAVKKSREDLTKGSSEADRESCASPSNQSETDDTAIDHEIEPASETRIEVMLAGQEAPEEQTDGDKKETDEQGAGAAAKNGGLSKFNLLRQSFNQKTISSMLKFSGRASMRIISGKPSARSRNDETEEEEEHELKAEVPRKPARSVKRSEEMSGPVVAKQHRQQQSASKLKERNRIDQQQQEQQIAALDSATLMLYNRHIQRQQRQQRQLMMQQQQQQHQQQQQFAFQWQQQMLIQQQRHHQQSQQLAYMANHYQVTTAHHHNQLLQPQAQPQFLPAGHALAPASIAPVAMGAGFASAAIYAGLPQVAHMAPAQHRSLIPQQQQQQAASKLSFASSAGTLLRKSIMRSSSKKQQQLVVADQEQLHQSSHLIPLAVNHHSSVNIVYADTTEHYAPSTRHEQQTAQNQPASRASSSLGASMRKTVKSMLVGSRALAASTPELDKDSARHNEQQPKKQLKSALKQARSRDSIVLNSEGSDGDGSSTTVESSSSADHQNSQRGQYVKPSILKKSSTIDKSSMLSLASDISTSSDDSSFKRATSTRCSRRIPASAILNKTAKADAPGRGPQQRKNVTFSTKLTSIL